MKYHTNITSNLCTCSQSEVLGFKADNGRFRPFLFPVTASAPSCGHWWELHPGLGGDFPTLGEAGKMVLILTVPLGRHSSPVREEREVVIPHTHTLPALEQAKETGLQVGTGFCIVMSAVDKPSLAEQRRVGTAIEGCPPPPRPAPPASRLQQKP